MLMWHTNSEWCLDDYFVSESFLWTHLMMPFFYSNKNQIKLTMTSFHNFSEYNMISSTYERALFQCCFYPPDHIHNNFTSSYKLYITHCKLSSTGRNILPNVVTWVDTSRYNINIITSIVNSSMYVQSSLLFLKEWQMLHLQKQVKGWSFLQEPTEVCWEFELILSICLTRTLQLEEVQKAPKLQRSNHTNQINC